MIKKYSARLIIAGICLLALALSSCKKLNPPETVPCYGHIGSLDITTVSGEGSASSDINCAWVYIDDQPVGAFELPCTFPMIASSGTHTVSIYPGVTVDGMASTRNKYPFYTYYEGQVNLTQGGTTNFVFTGTYASSAKFDWIEDFDGPGGITITKYSGDTNMFKVAKPDAFEGNYSGEVLLDSNASINQVSYIGVSDTMTLPHNGTSVFMEINYNSNCLFTMGVFYYDAGTSSYIQGAQWVSAFASTGWKKMYIDLGPMVANLSGPFKVYFSLIRPYGSTEAKLMLDNIKVLQFKGA